MQTADSANEMADQQRRLGLAAVECRRKLRASAEAGRIMSLPNFLRLCRRRGAMIAPSHPAEAKAIADLRAIYQAIQAGRKR